MDISEYMKAISRKWAQGNATEHSYRGCLEQMVQGLLPGLLVTNEPKRVACGAPDFIVTRRDGQPVFYIETKDIGDNDLDGRNLHGNKEQFTRYKSSLDHVVFTDYLDFHFYEYGEWVENVRIGEVRGDKVVLLEDQEERFRSALRRFADAKVQAITSASRLAEIMAAKARMLRHNISKALGEQEESYDNRQLRQLFDAFKDALIKDLDEEQFADMYAQTIAYGLFAARLHDDTPEDFTRAEAVTLIPKSNPFLRQVFNSIAGIDLDNRVAWIVDDLVQTFAATDVKRVMTQYGRDRRHNDPMIHFYEDFLRAYDPRMRERLGVYYTPQPVVTFIVRAVDELLKRDFGIATGLADKKIIHRDVVKPQEYDNRTRDGMKHVQKPYHRVQILDPATGTGTFLAEVINTIYDEVARKNAGIWQDYVGQHLLPRLNGFEILMASYAVAHLKLDMVLQDTGYVHNNDRRFNVFLTNSLEKGTYERRTLFSQALSAESEQANAVKNDTPVMVMIGNPPYSGESQNGELGRELVEKYKWEPGTNKHIPNTKWLNSDEVKFIALAQSFIERNEGGGIVGFINPHTYLEEPTFRGMRWQLLNTYDKIYVINLHGNKFSNETKGGNDENVFDIQQGVCINLFIKTNKKKENDLADVYYCSLYKMTRMEKYGYLDSHSLSTVHFEKLELQAPNYFFVPKDFAEADTYNKWFAINELFKIGGVGICSKRDKIAFHDSKKKLVEVLDDFQHLSEMEIKTKYQIKTESRDQKVIYAINNVKKFGIKEDYLQRIMYRPFVWKWTYFTDMSKGFLAFPVYDLMKHLAKGNNFALIVNNRIKSEDMTRYFVTDSITDLHVLETANAGCKIFPLYAYVSNMGEAERIPNMDMKLVSEIGNRIGEEVKPLELFDYIYAVLHSPRYRARYKEFLKIDFPRIPYPSDASVYHALAGKGAELRRLHLMEDADEWDTATGFPVTVGDNLVSAVRYDGGEERVYINDVRYFSNVPQTAWDFYVGGYQPAQKWLKDRKGQTLSGDDIEHYERIIHALTGTHRLMQEIDGIGAW